MTRQARVSARAPAASTTRRSSSRTRSSACRRPKRSGADHGAQGRPEVRKTGSIARAMLLHEGRRPASPPARVVVDGATAGEIGPPPRAPRRRPRRGEKEADDLARRIVNARIFADDAGRMNRRSRTSAGHPGRPEFTLLADTTSAPFVHRRVEPVRARSSTSDSWPRGVVAPRVRGGVFGAHMEVELVNDGPVTLIYDDPSSSGRSASGGRARATPAAALLHYQSGPQLYLHWNSARRLQSPETTTTSNQVHGA